MRLVYTFLMYVVTPVFALRQWLRGRRHGGQRGRWRERFGVLPLPRLKECLWLHAVSVGEVNAGQPLIEALLTAYPQWPLVVTTGTATGSDRVRQLFGARVAHVYLPYDLPFAVRRFLAHLHPRLGVVVETEIWPNLYRACRRRQVPLIIANARISRRSLRGAAPILRGLMKSALDCVTCIAAQSRIDGARYRLLGATAAQVSVAGNLKFDMPVPDTLRASGERMRADWGPARPVWIAASTHEGEEMAALDAHARVLQAMPDALLLLAPRHPERFASVAQLLRSRGVAFGSFQGGQPGPDMLCFLIDTMGRMLQFYAACDVAFVGGSLVPIGGHNVLEPAALGRPVLVGPNTGHFEGVTRTLIKAGAAVRIHDADELGARVVELLADRERCARMGAAGVQAVARERGAVGRVMALVSQVLNLPAATVETA